MKPAPEPRRTKTQCSSYPRADARFSTLRKKKKNFKNPATIDCGKPATTLVRTEVGEVKKEGSRDTPERREKAAAATASWRIVATLLGKVNRSPRTEKYPANGRASPLHVVPDQKFFPFYPVQTSQRNTQEETRAAQDTSQKDRNTRTGQTRATNRHRHETQTRQDRHPSPRSWNVMPAVGREELYLSCK